MSSIRKAAFVALALTTTAALAAVALANERETRPLNEPVHSIRLEGPIDLQLQQGGTRGVEIEASAAQRERIKLDLKDGELLIRYETERCGLGGCDFSAKQAPRAQLSVPTLRRLQIKGSGDANLADFDLGSGELRIEVNGSGDVAAARLSAAALAVAIRGSGDIKLAGRIPSQSISIAGSGDFDGSGLEGRSVSVSIKGSGDAAVWATEALAADVMGSGDISYRGQPQLAKQILGSGSIVARN